MFCPRFLFYSENFHLEQSEKKDMQDKNRWLDSSLSFSLDLLSKWSLFRKNNELFYIRLIWLLSSRQKCKETNGCFFLSNYRVNQKQKSSHIFYWEKQKNFLFEKAPVLLKSKKHKLDVAFTFITYRFVIFFFLLQDCLVEYYCKRIISTISHRSYKAWNVVVHTYISQTK